MCDFTEAQVLWIDLKSFVFRQIQVNLDINPRPILFVYHKQDSNFLVINIIYLVTKNIFLTPLEKKTSS